MGLGVTIDKASNNWGQKLLYGDEKDINNNMHIFNG